MKNGAVSPEIVITVLSTLLVFGIVYNALVARLERSGHDRGFTAFLVVGGVAVTLAAATWLVGLQPVMWLLACFAASGLPMVVGSWARYSRARQKNEQATINLAKEMVQDAETTGGRVFVEVGDLPGSQRE